MGKRTRISVVVLVVVAVAGLGYVTYVGAEGSNRLVEGTERGDCRTPDVQFGWGYEAINYDIADDAKLQTDNPNPLECAYQGTDAGDAVVTDDGIRIAGWYIPAANGAGPEAPTVVLMHGFHANKSGILKYGEGLHEAFNLVSFDMRNVGRSSGDKTAGGVLEQQDLRAVLDWLERTKHPTRIGVLGNSFGAATAFAEATRIPGSRHSRWTRCIRGPATRSRHASNRRGIPRTRARGRSSLARGCEPGWTSDRSMPRTNSRSSIPVQCS